MVKSTKAIRPRPPGSAKASRAGSGHRPIRAGPPPPGRHGRASSGPPRRSRPRRSRPRRSRPRRSSVPHPLGPSRRGGDGARGRPGPGPARSTGAPSVGPVPRRSPSRRPRPVGGGPCPWWAARSAGSPGPRRRPGRPRAGRPGNGCARGSRRPSRLRRSAPRRDGSRSDPRRRQRPSSGDAGSRWPWLRCSPWLCWPPASRSRPYCPSTASWRRPVLSWPRSSARTGR